MNLAYWSGMTIHILMVETTDGMLSGSAIIREAGAGQNDAHIRTAAMKRRIDDLSKAVDAMARAIGDAATRLSEPLYSVIPSPMGTEPSLIAAWRCRRGMTAIASTIPLPHLKDASVESYVVMPNGALSAV